MKSMRLFAGAAVAAALGLLAASPASAQNFAFGFSFYDGAETLQLTTSGGPVTIATGGNQGWWSGTFSNSAGNTNFFAGDPGNGSNLNDFFMFDISGLQGATVTGATLSITGFDITAPLTYRLADASALANAGVLLPTNGTNQAITNALGAGGLGSFALTPGFYSSQLTFALNSAGVSAINRDLDSGDRYFAVGGTVGNGAVPEPATWALMIGGFGLAGAALRRRTVATTA